MNKKQVKDSLYKQLESLGKTGSHFVSLVDDYIYLWGLKKKLQDDIKENGLRRTETNGNGFTVIKPNESIMNLTKIQTQMLKILTDLKLEEPLIEESTDDDYLS